MLTAQMLKDMEPGKVIATGITFDRRLYGDGNVKWAAVRGKGHHDWALYYHHDYMSLEFVLSSGDKSTTEAVIRELVPCDDEAYALYRM